MKTGTLKRYGNSAKIEEILVARMEERFRDGNVSEEIADYFLQQHAETEIPLLLCGKKKPRPAACSADDFVTLLDAGRITAGSCPLRLQNCNDHVAYSRNDHYSFGGARLGGGRG